MAAGMKSDGFSNGLQEEEVVSAAIAVQQQGIFMGIITSRHYDWA
jgi:hypothetical protein